MHSTKSLVQEVSRRNRLSEEAVSILLKALESGGYNMAQFNHPELGGMGQWSGGMTMIGDFSNSELRGRVERACSELVEGMKRERLEEPHKFEEESSANNSKSNDKNWWPENFGAISSSGSQNGCDYAYSRVSHRLAVRHDSQVTIYDTGKHEIYGVAQKQGHSSSLEFQSQLGTITAGDLTLVPVLPNRE